MQLVKSSYRNLIKFKFNALLYDIWPQGQGNIPLHLLRSKNICHHAQPVKTTTRVIVSK